ncbi:MAG TPA: histidine kinase, partial [Cellvibrionaceae bacterium]
MTSGAFKKSNLSLRSKLVLIVCLASVAGVASCALILAVIPIGWLAWALGLCCGLGSAAVLTLLLTRHLRLSLAAVEQGLLNLRDNDFSITLAPGSIRELNQLIVHYNALTESLRRERQSIYQRELLLDTIIENASMCVLIADQQQRIIFSNQQAELLLRDGNSLCGHKLSEIFDRKNPELMVNIIRQQSGIMPLCADSQDLYHLFTGQFSLNAQRHTLILMKEMTRELSRQEAATWKKVIRIISHELNNSLAPISSLAHSGKILVDKQQWQQLPEVFATLAERAEHLKNFVSGYADIAKLPLPRKTSVDWSAFYQGLSLGYPFTLAGELPREPGYFDLAQIQQLLLNLLK